MKKKLKNKYNYGKELLNHQSRKTINFISDIRSFLPLTESGEWTGLVDLYCGEEPMESSTELVRSEWTGDFLGEEWNEREAEFFTDGLPKIL